VVARYPDSCASVVQEDKENMQKELQSWRSEASRWQQRLHSAERGAHASATEQAAVDSISEEIGKRKHSIKLLKRQIVENENKLAHLLAVVIGDT
jgi:peptidoglycan hydrolase CwlO-like protein